MTHLRRRTSGSTRGIGISAGDDVVMNVGDDIAVGVGSSLSAGFAGGVETVTGSTDVRSVGSVDVTSGAGIDASSSAGMSGEVAGVADLSTVASPSSAAFARTNFGRKLFRRSHTMACAPSTSATPIVTWISALWVSACG